MVGGCFCTFGMVGGSRKFCWTELKKDLVRDGLHVPCSAPTAWKHSTILQKAGGYSHKESVIAPLPV